MIRKFLVRFLIIFNIGILPKCSQAQDDSFDKQLKDMMTSEELINFKIIDFESKLEALRTGNELFTQRFGLIQYQLNKQQKQWQDFEQKLDSMAHNLQNLQDKLSKENKEQLNHVKGSINQQYQTIMSILPAPVGNDKWELLLDIKETLKSFEEKFKNLENSVKNNVENHTKKLEDNISKNFKALEKIDKKLAAIENNSATKETQIAINKNLQKYINRNETMKICLESEAENLVCTADFYPSHCAEFNEKLCSNNTCRICNHIFGMKSFLVSCDNKSQGGGWTVIQRRMDGSVDFYRNWTDYKTGFGNLDGEFFIGLDKLNALTTTLKPVELLVQLRFFNDTLIYAKYDEFEIANEMEKYKLKNLGKYSGNARDCLIQQKGSNFTTKDQDNDTYQKNCGQIMYGGWWYKNCTHSKLNSKYYETNETGGEEEGLTWCSRSPHGYKYSFKFTQMAIRPRRL